VRLGSANRNLGSEFGADDVIRHSLYSPSTRSNDVALLRLDGAPPLGDGIAPLRVVAADESALWAPGTLASIVGWGTTCFEQCATTTNLKEAGAPIVSDPTCSSVSGRRPRGRARGCHDERQSGTTRTLAAAGCGSRCAALPVAG